MPLKGSKKRAADAAAEEGGAHAEPDGAAEAAERVPSAPPAEAGGDDGGSDSEDDGVRNMLGDIPLEWYDDYDHIGYGLDGQRIVRPPQRDELDALIERYDRGNSRTVYDALHGELIELTDEDVGMIRRIQSNQYPDANFNPYPATIEWVSSVPEKEPLWQRPEPKSRFVPSKWERKRVSRLVRAMRSESYARSQAAQAAAKERQRPDYNYAIWDETLEDLTREQRRVMYKRLRAPKQPPPTNAESYNPPAEYLLTPQEEAEWRGMDPEDRPTNFLPAKHDSLRRVPAYDGLCAERFQRCLDLYLCPRTQRAKLAIEPDSLLPQLPDLSQLEPYPKRLSASYRAGAGCVRTLAVHPAGQWLATGGDDGVLRLWEVSTTRCVLEWRLGGEGGGAEEGAPAEPEPIHRLAFAPSPDRSLLAASVGSRVLLLAIPHLHPPPRPPQQLTRAAAAALAGAAVPAIDDAVLAASPAAAGPTVVEWLHERLPAPTARAGGRQPRAAGGAPEAAGPLALAIAHAKPARQLAWHPRCDYVATVVPDGGARAVLLHQLSRRVSQQPFAKSKGRVEAGEATRAPRRTRRRARLPPPAPPPEPPPPPLLPPACAAVFHPRLPRLFVGTQRQVRVYDLVKQTLLQTLRAEVQWISSLAVHPSGDNLIVGSYDKRVVWFDLDLGAKPYKALRCAHARQPAARARGAGGRCRHPRPPRALADAACLPARRRSHSLAVRAVAFHERLPLFASCSDDLGVQVYHGQVHDDLNSNATLVPLKRLEVHAAGPAGLGVMDCAFHPQQPWLFSCGADGAVHLYT